MVASGVFATHHMVPVDALKDRELKRFFDDYFPGFNIESHANFAEKARNPFAGQQLNIGTQDSDHPWIITALKRIRTEVLSIHVDADGNRVLADSLDIDFVKTEAERVRVTAGLMNVFFESNDVKNLHPDGRTGGLFSFTSKSDADAIILFQKRPEESDLSRYYDLMAHAAPVVVWGFLGTEPRLNQICYAIKVCWVLGSSVYFITFRI